MADTRKAVVQTLAGDDVHGSYRLAREACIDTGATHACPPSGKSQCFYKRMRIMGSEAWAFSVVFLRADGYWTRGPWLLDYAPPVGTMGSLPFVDEIPEPT